MSENNMIRGDRIAIDIANKAVFIGPRQVPVIPRDFAVLASIYRAEGYITNSEIARQLCLERPTVANRVASLRATLGARCIESGAGNRRHRRPVISDRSDDEMEVPDSFVHRGTWNAAEKARAVLAVRCGQITLEDLCRQHGISMEEFNTWESRLAAHGEAGLRSTRSRLYV